MSRKPNLRPSATTDKRMINDFMPPEGVPIHFRVAGLGARVAAQVIDIIITFAIIGATMAALYYGDLVSLETVEALGTLLFFMLRVPYYTAAEILLNGQTIGKRMMGLRVISADGRTLSAHAVTVRNMMKEMEVFVPGTYLLIAINLEPYVIAILTVWIIFLLSVPLFNKRRQRLGDIIANTFVAEMPKPVLLPEVAAVTEAQSETKFSFLPHHLDHYGRYELQTLEALLQIEPHSLDPAAQKQHDTNIGKVAAAITARVGYGETVAPPEFHEFLIAFYTAQRAFLENRKLFGDTREDKYHREG